MAGTNNYYYNSDDDLNFEMNGSIDGYKYLDGTYIINRVWVYMQQEDMSFEEALNDLNLNYDDAIADEEDIQQLDAKRKRLMEDPNRFPYEYDEDDE